MEDVSEILKAAIRKHQAGNLQEAEQLYGQVIEDNPGHPLALHSLGIVAHQRGQTSHYHGAGLTVLLERRRF